MSRSVGIVAEFNPFHNGHKYLLNRAREFAGEDGTVICVMSGDFVQRGEPAIFNKHARAEAACRSGANLVAELPLPWSILSAEGFASAGIDILDAMGTQGLVFGAENDNITELEKLAEILLSPGTDVLISKQLEACPQKSYAAARRDVIESITGLGGILDSPNNILGVEYIKASIKKSSGLKYMAVGRQGAAHDCDIASGPVSSASYVRRCICSGYNFKNYVTAASSDIITRELNAGRGPVNLQCLEQAVLSRLRMLSADCYESLPDSGGGAGRRLYNTVCGCSGIDEILNAATTNRYPTARMRRMLMYAVLGITENMAAMNPPYIKILAADEKGREYLKQNCAYFKKSLIIKPASVKTLGEECETVFKLNSSARDLYVLGYKNEADRRTGSDYRTSPVMI